MSIDIRQIKKFVAVAKTRNFTQAAGLLHMTQPSLSKQIQQLEERLGARLFQRDSRPIRLTEAGRRFYEDALAVLDRVEQMEQTARRLGLGGKRIFNVGFVASALYGGLPTVMRRLMERREDVEVRWLEMTSVEQQDALRRGIIDVGFGRIITGDASVTRVVLRQERLFLALPRSTGSHGNPGRSGCWSWMARTSSSIQASHDRVTPTRCCRCCANMARVPRKCTRSRSCKRPWLSSPRAAAPA